MSTDLWSDLRSSAEALTNIGIRKEQKVEEEKYYNVVVHKIVTQRNVPFKTSEEARMYGAGMKKVYQQMDPGAEYWFEYEVAEDE